MSLKDLKEDETMDRLRRMTAAVRNSGSSTKTSGIDPTERVRISMDGGARAVLYLIVASVIALTGVIFIGNMWENLDAEHIMVIQSPVAGDLTWHTTPGIKYQGFGKITKYPRREQFWFSLANDQGNKDDESIPIRFNDGGHGAISGSLAWEMPVGDVPALTSLHTKYGSYDAIEHQLIRTVVEKAVYMTGPLMSSQESYASRRNELLNLIDEQITHGVYKTESEQVKSKDTMTGVEKTITLVKLIKGTDGKYLRQDESPLQEYKIRVSNLSINKIPYDKEVEIQIKAQQGAIMQVQTAIADAKRAEQAAITAEKNGQAQAATAKWTQEAIKAQKVTEAEQQLKVQELDAKAAEQEKRAMISRGEGEAAAARLVMQANGALETKIKAWIEVNKFYAEAVGKHTGPWVPSIVMGESGKNSQGASALIELLSVKTAKDLSLDMNMKGK